MQNAAEREQIRIHERTTTLEKKLAAWLGLGVLFSEISGGHAADVLSKLAPAQRNNVCRARESGIATTLACLHQRILPFVWPRPRDTH